jgi:5'-methylthioadenosine phosphorylase
MRVGIVTGTGTYALPELEVGERHDVETPFGAAQVSAGSLGGVEVLHVSRHGEGHVRLSSSVNHRANVLALKALGADCAIGLTVCGAVDLTVPLGGLILFDDLHFPVNRLPDGSLCTLHPEAGDPRRGHWIYEGPFSEGVRRALAEGIAAAGLEFRDGGTYGHVDGPRFNTRSEIAQLAAARVTAVSQTAGSETVLCGEAELPYALLGYATDYANGVAEEATPVSELVRLMGESTQAFARVLAATLPSLEGREIAPAGVMYRFEQPG